jgi:hypothetical protein
MRVMVSDGEEANIPGGAKKYAFNNRDMNG